MKWNPSSPTSLSWTHQPRPCTPCVGADCSTAATRLRRGTDDSCQRAGDPHQEACGFWCQWPLMQAGSLVNLTNPRAIAHALTLGFKGGRAGPLCQSDVDFRRDLVSDGPARGSPFTVDLQQNYRNNCNIPGNFPCGCKEDSGFYGGERSSSARVWTKSRSLM